MKIDKYLEILEKTGDFIDVEIELYNDFSTKYDDSEADDYMMVIRLINSFYQKKIGKTALYESLLYIYVHSSNSLARKTCLRGIVKVL